MAKELTVGALLLLSCVVSPTYFMHQLQACLQTSKSLLPATPQAALTARHTFVAGWSIAG